MKLSSFAKCCFQLSILSTASFFAYALSSHHQQSVVSHDQIKPNVSRLAPSGFSPAQIRLAYGLSLTAQQGEGQTVALVTPYDNPNVESDLSVFNTEFGLSACTTANGCFKKVFANGTPPANQSWATGKAAITQWIHAIAPLAKIMLVETMTNSNDSLLQGVQVAVSQGATVVIMNWGQPEFSTQSQYDTYFNNPNVAFVASAGNAGTLVQWPAVSPYVIGVAGTTLTTDAQGNYVSETAWSNTGGGVSANNARPAYQANFANQNNPNNMRGLPDVAFHANPTNGLAVYDSYGSNGWAVVGGTGLAAGSWAGVLAVIKSAATAPVPNLNSLLYQAATTSYATAYHDITTGSNGTCGAVCTAGIGYDYVSGLGTPIVDNLVTVITGGGSCTRVNPTITFSPDTLQTIQQDRSVTIDFQIKNNDSATCAASTFDFSVANTSTLINSVLNVGFATLQPGASASGYMIVKATNVAVVGQTYSAVMTAKDAANNRSASFASNVIIGNP